MNHEETSKGLPIAQLGQPVLRQKADPVTREELGSAELLEFIDQMVETLEISGGVGLAAPQVFKSKRIFLAAFERPDEEDKLELEVFINPVVTPMGEEKELGWEGCLSFLELYTYVPRYVSVRVDYLTPDGDESSLELTGFAARVVQHENDHLDGILTIDRAPSTLDIVKTSEIEAVIESRRKNQKQKKQPLDNN